MATEWVKVMIRIDSILHDKIKHVAYLQRESVNKFVSEALEEKLAKVIFENPTYDEVMSIIDAAREDR